MQNARFSGWYVITILSFPIRHLCVCVLPTEIFEELSHLHLIKSLLES